MNIGIIPDPESHRDWEAIKALLEPAAKRGGVPVLEEGEQVWSVTDGAEHLAAATARTTVENFGEIILVGGVQRRRWLAGLDRLISSWLTDEGMQCVRAYGRMGWKRELEAMGWRVIGRDGKIMAYEKAL